MSICCIEIDTPQSILDDTETDVFATSLSAYTESSWYTELYNNLWARYRHRMINSCSVDLWEQLCSDKVTELMTIYKAYLDAYYGLSDSEKANALSDGSTTTMWYQREDMPDTPAENIPDMEGNPVYLSERNKTKTQTEGARTDLLSIEQAFEIRMDLIRRFVDDMGTLFLNRWM